MLVEAVMVIVLLVAGALVLGADVYDTVAVDVEGHLNLRHTARRSGNAGQLEAAQGLVVVRHGTLALQHVDFHSRLAVGRGGEHLRLAGGDGGVALDELGEDVALGFKAQAQRRHVQEQHVLDLAAQHAGLNGSAHSHALIGVDALEGVLVGDLLHRRLHSRDTGGAAHQNDLINLRPG